MKQINIIIISTAVFLNFFTYAIAEVFVVYKNDSKEIMSISPIDDAVVESGWSKEVLKGSIEDYPLEYNCQDYKFIDKKFIVNTKKISDRENLKQQAIQEEKNKEENKKKALKKLQDLGLTDSEVNALFN